MVTLLLCFFVMLYSMSSVDQQKWEILVKSFNPKDAEKVSQIVVNESENTANNDVNGGIKTPPEKVDNFEDLYYTLTKAVEENNLEGDVEIKQGDGFTFISFNNKVFFDADSYVLKDEGKTILDDFSLILGSGKDLINEIQVLGHTSQADPEKVNNIANDRLLSSNRATVVVIYLQEKNIFDPAKLASCGYGQFRPISPFDTPENRAKNRRVEMLVTKNDGVARSLDEYYKEVYK